MAISDAIMENRDIPIEICEDEKFTSKNLDDKMNARIKVIDAVENAKKMEISKSDEYDPGRMNIWGNENMSFFLLKNDLMKDLDIFNTKDSQVIRMKDNNEMFEVSLDTSKYRPDELSITVEDGIISVEGKHEEQSEDGRKMVSRQFSRKYSLPAGATGENVVSNLSSDGVLVITVNKKTLHGESVTMSNTECKTCDVATNVHANELIKNERIPTNLRSNFFTDPFFKSNWDKHENVHHKIKSIFSPVLKDKTQKITNVSSTNETKQEKENEEKRNLTTMNKKFGNYRPRRWMLPALSTSSAFDTLASINSDIISQKEDQNVFEWKVDTSEYEPEEVKVTVSPDCILVEGCHEETSTEGKQILSRNFTKKYSLPAGIKQEDVISKFTPDCGLTITAKRNLQNQNDKDEKAQEIKTEHSIIEGQKTDLNVYMNEDENVLNKNKLNGGVKVVKAKLVEDNTMHRNVKIEQQQENNMKMSEDITDKSTTTAKNNEEEYKRAIRGAGGVKMHLSNPSEILNNRNVRIEHETKNVSDNVTENSKSTLTNKNEENKKSIRGAAGVRMHLMSSKNEENQGDRNIKIEQKDDTKNLSNNDKENAKSFGEAVGVKMHIINSAMTSEKKENEDSSNVQIEPEKEKENLPENFTEEKVNDMINNDEEYKKSIRGAGEVKINFINSGGSEEKNEHKHVQIEPEKEKDNLPENVIEEKLNDMINSDEEYKKSIRGASEVKINFINSGGNEEKNEHDDNISIKSEQHTDEDLKVHITDVTDDNEETIDSNCGFRKIKIERDTAKKETDLKILEKEKQSKDNQLINSHIVPERKESNDDRIQKEKENQNQSVRIEREELKEEHVSTGFEFGKDKIEHKTVKETEEEIVTKGEEVKSEQTKSKQIPEVIENINTNAHNEKQYHRNIQIKENNASENRNIKNTQDNIVNDCKTSRHEFRKVNIDQKVPSQEKHMSTKSAFQEEKQKEEGGRFVSNFDYDEFSPKNWRLSSNLSRKLDLFQTEDDQVIRMVDNKEKFEVSLDTSQYRPDELKVYVGEGVLSVEGKHEENSEDGRKMVSRQFSRKYNLPAGTEAESVVSNLSSDGVLIITVRKQSLRNVKEESMNMIDEDSRVPITMRYLFFDDPFFRSTWSDFDSIKENMFNESSTFWKGLNENSLQSEKSMFSNHHSLVDEMMQSCLHEDTEWMMPRKWMMPSMFRSDFARQADMFQTKDSEVIGVKENGEKFEMSLNTTQYRPDELKVTVGEGIISVEGKHEEKSGDGRKMVSRQFSRRYSLPAGAKAENVFSNLSSDGVLTVSAPKEKDTTRGQRSVPIQSTYSRY